MRITRVSFVGIKTDHFDAMGAFAKDVLGEIVADVVWAAEAFDQPTLIGWGWPFFRAPDGNVYGLQQDQEPSREGAGT